MRSRDQHIPATIRERQLMQIAGSFGTQLPTRRQIILRYERWQAGRSYSPGRRAERIDLAQRHRTFEP